MKQILHKIFSKQNLTKFIIVFSIGLISRYLVNTYFDINVFLEFKSHVSILYYSGMAIFIVVVHECVDHFNLCLIPQPVIDVFHKPLPDKLDEVIRFLKPDSRHVSSNQIGRGNTQINDTQPSRHSSGRHTESRTVRNRQPVNSSVVQPHSSELDNKQVNQQRSRHTQRNRSPQRIRSETQTRRIEVISNSFPSRPIEQNLNTIRDNRLPPNSYYRKNNVDAYRHQLTEGNRNVSVNLPINNNDILTSKVYTPKVQHNDYNRDSFSNRVIRDNQRISIDTFLNNCQDIDIDDLYMGANNRSPTPRNFRIELSDQGDILLRNPALSNSNLSNKSEASSGVRRVIGERRTRVFEQLNKNNIENMIGYSDKEVLVSKKSFGDRLLLGFRFVDNKVNNTMSKIDSIYIKYYDGSRRRLLWTIWEKNHNKFESYKDFKSSWDPKSSVWKKISSEIKHDISEEVRNLIRVNNPFDNKRIQTDTSALLKELNRHRRK